MSVNGLMTVTCTKDVVKYLLDNYKVDETTAKIACGQQFGHDTIKLGIKMGSFVYFVGDKIADAEKWEEIFYEDICDADVDNTDDMVDG